MRISDWSSDVCSSDLRSVRTPSRIDRQLTYPSLVEGGTFDSEKLIAIEAGYRGQPLRDTTLSISLFYNLYDGLRSTELDPVTIFPVRLDNGWKGHSYGEEIGRASCRERVCQYV